MRVDEPAVKRDSLMNRFLSSLLVAVTIGSASMLMSTGSIAAPNANTLFKSLQQSGADTTYVQQKRKRVGAVQVFRDRGPNRWQSFQGEDFQGLQPIKGQDNGRYGTILRDNHGRMHFVGPRHRSW